jgi:GNAT superfamily N-acetyltransferase
MGYFPEESEVIPAVRAVVNGLKGSYSSGVKITYDSNPFTLTLEMRDNKTEIAGFTLTQQVNCCGILVSTQTYVMKKYQGKGIAKEMMPIKEALAKEFGYSLLMATVNMTGNPAEVHILEKFGWKLVSNFTNSRTKHKVGVFTKEVV